MKTASWARINTVFWTWLCLSLAVDGYANMCHQSFGAKVKSVFSQAKNSIKSSTGKINSAIAKLNSKKSLAALRQEGVILTHTSLSRLRIPKVLRSHYDLSTGELNYKPLRALELRPQNGSLKVKSLRMNINIRPSHKMTELDIRIAALQLKHVASIIKNTDLNMVLFVPKEAAGDYKKKLTEHFDTETIAKRVDIVDVSPKINQIPLGMNSRWAKDDILVSSDGTPILPASNIEFRTESRLFFARRYFRRNALHLRSPFMMDGGALVVGDRHLFMSSLAIAANAEKLRISPKNAVRALEAEFGKEIFVLGDVKVGNLWEAPDYHADLSMMILKSEEKNRETVYLSSLDKAIELLEGTEYSILANLKTARESEEFVKREGQIKELKDKLIKQGYDVELLPGFYHEKVNKFAGRPHQIGFFNFVNSFVDKGLVITGRSGNTILDNYVASRFLEAGFESLMLKNTKLLLSADGGVGCITCVHE